jgi:hypothetical protein
MHDTTAAHFTGAIPDHYERAELGLRERSLQMQASVFEAR